MLKNSSSAAAADNKITIIRLKRLKRRLTTDHEPIFDPGVGGDRPSILTIHSTCDARLEKFWYRHLITFS